MTFDEIVQMVADDLNLTSATAITRIGKHVNVKYRELLAKSWMEISRRYVVTQPVSVGIQEMTIPNVTKVYDIFDPNRANMTLNQMTFDEIRNITPLADPPNNWAVSKQNAVSVTVILDSLPGSVYNLMADADLRLVTLSGSMLPRFNEDFHDILYFGAKYLELLKMEKPDLAAEAGGTQPTSMWNQRISDIKFHIAKSGYTTWRQGQDRTIYPAFVNTIVPS